MLQHGRWRGVVGSSAVFKDVQRSLHLFLSEFTLSPYSFADVAMLHQG